jgi:hypothetical protein
MYMKTAAIILTVFLALSGCGYKLALPGKEADFSIYPAVIANNSGDIEASHLFRDAVLYYLTSINAVKSADKAAFTGEFTLLRFDSAGTSDSSRTTTAYVHLTVSAVIKDKNGQVTLSRNFSRTENYDNTASLPQTSANRDTAFKNAAEKIMKDFRNVFEQR